MPGYRRVFIDTTDFYSLVTTGVNTNVIYLNPFDYMAVHAGTISGLQTLSLQGTELTEIAVADVDILANVGKYAVTAGNSIGIVVAKGSVDTEAKAKNYIQGLLLYYQMKTLEYNGASDIYTLETYTANGTFIGSTDIADIADLNTKIICLDQYQNVNTTVGYQYHILTHALTVSA